MTPVGFSVTGETLDEAQRRKRLTARPTESIRLERKSIHSR